MKRKALTILIIAFMLVLLLSFTVQAKASLVLDEPQITSKTYDGTPLSGAAIPQITGDPSDTNMIIALATVTVLAILLVVILKMKK